MNGHPKNLSVVPPKDRDGVNGGSRRQAARREANDREVMYFAYDRLGMPLLYADPCDGGPWRRWAPQGAA